MTSTTNFEPAQIPEMVHEIAARFHPRRIILFGSYATGVATQDSDVDLLVITDDQPGRNDAIAIRRSLAGFPVACDIIVQSAADYQRWRKVVNHIVYFAEKYGKVVYEH